MGRRRHLARHAEELAEADVVLPQRLLLGVGERADEELVEVRRRIGDHRHRPQHQLGVERGVAGPGGVGARVGRHLALDPPVQAVDEGEGSVGLGAGAEVDLLEDPAGVGEALERPQLPAVFSSVPVKATGWSAPIASARCPYISPTARSPWIRRSTDRPRGK